MIIRSLRQPRGPEQKTQKRALAELSTREQAYSHCRVELNRGEASEERHTSLRHVQHPRRPGQTRVRRSAGHVFFTYTFVDLQCKQKFGFDESTTLQAEASA